MNRSFKIFMQVLRRIIPVFLIWPAADLPGQEGGLAQITVTETAGLSRTLEYVDLWFQLPEMPETGAVTQFVATEVSGGEIIICQLYDERPLPNRQGLQFRLLLPVSIEANQMKTFNLSRAGAVDVLTDLQLGGRGYDLQVENEYYRADLSRSSDSPEKNHESGQIREILIKMGFDQMLTNAEDPIHWGPNFERPELEYYKTIAHWEKPAYYRVDKGPFMIRTQRRDAAPFHPEIMLTAIYRFYAGLPYFRFFSRMEFTDDLWLELLRNDEMTMDSMFTHIGFLRPDGELVEVEMEKRQAILKERPIESDAPWLCFYNMDHGYAFGSVRLRYDNSNELGDASPLIDPYTQIGAWLDRRYWNRRLIHDQLTLVPAGSRYAEENAYLVFRIGEEDRFSPIKYWAERLRHPLKVQVQHQRQRKPE